MRPAFLLLTTSLLLASHSARLDAFIAPHYAERGKNALPIAIKQRVIRPELSFLSPRQPMLSKNSPAPLSIGRDTISGAVRLLSGTFEVAKLESTAQVADYERVARDYIAKNPPLFGVSLEEVQLIPSSTLIAQDVQFIRFSVHRNNIRISDAYISFRFKQGQLVQIVNNSFAEARETEGPDEEASSLAEKVRALTAAHRVEDAAVAYRVSPAPNHKSYLLTKVHTYNIATHLGNLRAQIATQNATLFELRDTHHHVDEGSDEELRVEVQADVHPRWYDDALEHRKMRNLGVTTARGTIHTPESLRPLEEPDAVPSLQGLVGKFVSISPVSGGTVQKTASLVDQVWTIHAKKEGSDKPYLDKTIAQWMVYYHTDAIIRRAKKYISSPWLDGKLTANVNLTRTCNAHWDGSTINLYSGSESCANTGTIADVVYHEWGHGLDDNTGGIGDGAFSEGYGDILALVMTHSNLLGIGFRLPDKTPVRDLAPLKKYPDDRGEVHSEGLIIGSTFWDLFNALKAIYGEEKAGEIIANYAFKMIFTASTYLEVYQALLVIDDNDTNTANGTPNLCTLNEVFTLHGLATKDERCTLASIDAYAINDSNGNGNGIIEPGEQINLQVQAANKTPQALEGLQGSLSLASGNNVEITQGALSWPNIPANSSALSENAAELRVDAAAVCGSTFSTNLELSSQQRKITLKKTFTIGENQGKEASFSAAGLPQPINDNATTTATLTISGEQWSHDNVNSTVAAGTLKFALHHTYLGDLTVVLHAPDGTEWEIYRGNGRGRELNFEKDVSELLRGKVGSGEWQLKVTDSARRDQGTLDSFQLRLTPSLFVCH
jgi:subtilisin-like proprotein convertase family protein